MKSLRQLWIMLPLSCACEGAMLAHASSAMAIQPRALDNVFMVIGVRLDVGMEMGSGLRMLCVLDGSMLGSHMETYLI